jgi:GAF domain-containing protein
MGAMGADLQSVLHADPAAFPFRCELSLAPLIDFWTKKLGDEHTPKGAIAHIVSEAVREAPGLLGTIDDPAVLAPHRDLMDVLMAAAFPPGLREREFGAAMSPFQMRGFYATASMRRLLMAEDGRMQGRVNLDEATLHALRLALAYTVILRRVYGVEIEVDYPLILTITDPDTRLDRYFRMLFDWQFIEVETVGQVPSLTDDVRQRLRANILDAEFLQAMLPPDRFVLRGFTLFRAVDVTDQEVLSGLKRDLIHRDSVVSDARFDGLQTRLRTLFRRPDLRLGLAAIDGERVLLLNVGSRHEHSCIFADSKHHLVSEFKGSVFEHAVKQGQPVIIEDLTALPTLTSTEEDIVCSGQRSMVVAPLHYQDKIIGTLDLTSPHPGDLDATHLPKLREVVPLFAMAVQRSMEELNARIQTEIKEQFTAIHPVVEWRFRKTVLDSLERGRASEDGGPAELEPIVFDGVYPLYALSDIRGSSTQRVLAIQADLAAQLRLARAVVETARQVRPLPALDELVYRIDQHARRIEGPLASGDEVGVVTFLRQDVESLFEHLREFGEGVRDRIEAYRGSLDPKRGTVYAQRAMFEESVTRLSDGISTYLDLEEQAAQSMFPHYFEKRKTDGVDHQIYVGGSLLEDGRFDPLYLKNLRLWQLMVVCGIASRADQIAARLPMPLETTHLILAQQAPLSIRFRFDEKHFDVDGAYDLRYEIVKKRIDKALVRGGTERVTQPGRIAIVYTQAAEAVEYRGYVEYLQHLGYLAEDVEDLELEELQGVSGVRALRVTVALHAAEADPGRVLATVPVTTRE